MADFIHEFWSWFISIGTIGGLIFCVLIIWANNSAKPVKEGEEAETMGHVWDGDLAEYNNPLPKWWLNMFYITLIFSAIYLLLYPGLGSYQGLLDWSSKGRYENEVKQVEAAHAPLYAGYLATPIAELSNNPEAMGTAKRIFSTNCAVCHGADAKGYTGFPNLTDNDWLYGGDEATIKATLVNGRNAVMPAWGLPLGEKGVTEVAEYIYSLTRTPLNPRYVEAGKQRYMTMCIACHGAEAKGNPALGAPNLADKIWLYGGSIKAIAASVEAGRNGAMPAFGAQLTASQIHLLTAYLSSFQANGNN